MALTEQQRKNEIQKITSGLKCRCPGFQTMTHAECRGIDGIKYCTFTCEDAQGNETLYPWGDPSLCKCTLGTSLDPIVTRTLDDGQVVWGYARCNQLAEGMDTSPFPSDKKQAVSVVLPWVVAISAGALLWYATKKN
jgi:hypothetical protein